MLIQVRRDAFVALLLSGVSICVNSNWSQWIQYWWRLKVWWSRFQIGRHSFLMHLLLELLSLEFQLEVCSFFESVFCFNIMWILSPVYVFVGHLFVEGLLLVVILFLLSQKSYKPPKRPLTKKVCVSHSELLSSLLFLYSNWYACDIRFCQCTWSELPFN